jgi:hypothetical protein
MCQTTLGYKREALGSGRVRTLLASKKPSSLTSLTKSSNEVNRLETSAILSTPLSNQAAEGPVSTGELHDDLELSTSLHATHPSLSTRRASRSMRIQSVPIKLRQHTTASTISPPATPPGSGTDEHSASTT